MSDRQRGNQRENRCADILDAIGYCCYPSRGSRGSDIVALHREEGFPNLEVAVVRPTGSVTENFAKMRGYETPANTVRIAVREVEPYHFRWYDKSNHRGGHADPLAAIAAARESQ